eukprot:6492397-Amphidinium_carterae.1
MIGLNCVLGVQQNHCDMQLGCNHKAVERVYAALRHEVACKVRHDQQHIDLNPTDSWTEVEVDEVTLRKVHLDGGVSWVEYIGFIRRGFPETLIVVPMEPRVTKRRAPGAGPLRTSEWIKIGTRFLSGKRI